MENNNNYPRNPYVNNYDPYWNFARQHRFEKLSVEIPFDAIDRYEQIASHFRGRTTEEIRKRDLMQLGQSTEEPITLANPFSVLDYFPSSLHSFKYKKGNEHGIIIHNKYYQIKLLSRK
ncbi:hypothetical protein TSUD_277780 [Trifolium subterraneum]|uniref:Uncharacterized protein n=1 Tax=Trifolium subterraneum TaxID=3900 RepID=A0A2Z6MJC4_TRISU|nr:hypothetical protein TSUD_277780 [Trifolium subterraneum]